MRPNFGWEIRKIEPNWENSSRKLGNSFSILGKFLLNIRKIHPQKNGSRRENHFFQLWCQHIWNRHNFEQAQIIFYCCRHLLFTKTLCCTIPRWGRWKIIRCSNHTQHLTNNALFVKISNYKQWPLSRFKMTICPLSRFQMRRGSIIWIYNMNLYHIFKV